MKRRTFLQSLTAAFTAVFVWDAPKIQRTLELTKRIYHFVETRYAERKITAVAQHEILRRTESEMWGREPKPDERADYEVAIVGRMTTPAVYPSANISNDTVMAEAIAVIYDPEEESLRHESWRAPTENSAKMPPDVEASYAELETDFTEMARKYDLYNRQG